MLLEGGGEEKRACRTPTDSAARCSQKNKQQTNKNYKTSPYSVIWSLPPLKKKDFK